MKWGRRPSFGSATERDAHADRAEVVRVGLCGLGQTGKAIGRLIIGHRPGLHVVGAATLEPDAIGRSLGEVVGVGEGGPRVSDGLDAVLDAEPDVVIYATVSFLDAIKDDVIASARAGANVISPCEQLAFPFNLNPTAAREIHAAALESRVTVLGAGANPGFLFDALLLTLSGACWEVDRVRGRRVVDVSGYGEAVHTRLGIGALPQDVDERVRSGDFAGHVGLSESIEMVAERLGVQLDGLAEESFEGIVAAEEAPTVYGTVGAGRLEGLTQRATGHRGGSRWIELELVLHLRPEHVGLEVVDMVEIAGANPLRLTISPGLDSIPATAAEVVNSIPGVIRADPGLKSVKDLPASAAWLAGSAKRLIRN